MDFVPWLVERGAALPGRPHPGPGGLERQEDLAADGVVVQEEDPWRLFVGLVHCSTLQHGPSIAKPLREAAELIQSTFSDRARGPRVARKRLRGSQRPQYHNHNY